ncbi:MAG: transposase [Planctomycetaceae bacterium]|nr:transposase [Planctomycetaceae bacterium]
MTDYFIALDVHCAFSEMAVMTQSGKLIHRQRLPTSIPNLREAIANVRRPRKLTFEEGPLADWLSRELHDHVNELVVCDPCRNHWIAREGDKDDPIDALKLADLYRGGYLKKVHQPNTLKRSLLKQQVSMYHSRVRERVRQSNQLAVSARRTGLRRRWKTGPAATRLDAGTRGLGMLSLAGCHWRLASAWETMIKFACLPVPGT